MARNSKRKAAAARDGAAMTKEELKLSGSLASVYMLRMMGIFLMLPVFSVYAAALPGGSDKGLVGLAFGVYGLTQALLQMPFGLASDRFGRKKAIYFGLVVFALGSFMCAVADSVQTLAVARALQGAGAISGVVTALMADLTREEVRTRAMSMIGIGIGLTFSLSLIVSPILGRAVGVRGIFALTGVLALIAALYVRFFVPDPPVAKSNEDSVASAAFLPSVLKNKPLWRLNFGIFVVHCAQMALFAALPFALIEWCGVGQSEHWKIYLPATVVGFVAMIPAVVLAETKEKMKPVFMGSIVVLGIAQLALVFSLHSAWAVALSLCLYFAGLDVAEAALPSWVSKIVSPKFKGTAMGMYSAFMSIGIFCGGLAGGFIAARWGLAAVFGFNAALMLVWLASMATMPAPLSVRTLIFGLDGVSPQRIDAALAAAQKQKGVLETFVSADGLAMYVKIKPRECDAEALKGALGL